MNLKVVEVAPDYQNLSTMPYELVPRLTFGGTRSKAHRYNVVVLTNGHGASRPSVSLDDLRTKIRAGFGLPD